MTSVDAFNTASAPAAVELLRPCCASTAWATTVAAGRPYTDLAAVLAASDPTLAALPWPDVADALAAHPRIGDRLQDAATTETTWSRREQAGVAGASADTLAALAAGNAAYEARFGHVYLVCASGRSAEELLDILRDRLGNDPVSEQDVVRGELAAITRLRLTRLFDGAPAASAGTVQTCP